jgi:two-component system OmpR family sensor kinase
VFIFGYSCGQRSNLVSIRLRLTIWYVGLLAGLLIGFNLLVYSVLSIGLKAEAERTIQGRAQVVSTFIQEENDPLFLLVSGMVTLPPIDVFSSPDVYVQIIWPDGSIVSRSDNLGGQQLPVDTQHLERVLKGVMIQEVTTVGASRLLLHSEPLSVGGRNIGVVQVGQSLQEMDQTLRFTAYLLAASSVITVCFAAVIGFLLARSALRPIDQMTRAALEISRTSNLQQRLEVISQDELGRLAETFNEMLERLEVLFSTQERFVADVSHELRTPLTTIQGNVDLLKRGVAQDPETGQEALAIIEEEAGRMARLASDLLLLAQADAGIKLDLKPVELDTLLLEVYRQGRLMVAGQEIKLGHEDQAIVLGDADRLKQLLLNLVDNAVKYTPAGGQIVLMLYREPEWTRVLVKDSGIGIPAEDLPRIFDRFYRVERPRSEGKTGTGLGLSIARWVAEAHGGNLTVESQQGEGTTFTLWLQTRRGSG